MELTEFVEQALEDYRRRAYGAIGNLSQEEMVWRADDESNSIAFLVWHVARVEDRWTQTFARGEEEVWLRDGWPGQLEMPDAGTGLNYTAEQLKAFPEISKEDLQSYFDAVREETLGYLHSLSSDDFDVAPGRTPFPEFPAVVKYFEGCTIGRMYRQLIAEEDQHLGQISFIRGLQRGLGK